MGVAELEAFGEAFSDGDGAQVADDRAAGEEVIGDGGLAQALGGRGGDLSQRRDEYAGGALQPRLCACVARAARERARIRAIAAQFFIETGEWKIEANTRIKIFSLVRG